MRTKIVFEDSHLLVIHKPAGLATQSARVGEADVVSELKNYLAGKRETTYVGVIHRLDQPVEGLLVFAKTKNAAAALTKQLNQGILNKTYKALVYGIPKETEKRVVSYLEKQGNVALVSDSKETLRDGKEAILSYKVLEQKEAFSLAAIQIETGRFHQIRAQLAFLGHPILGDSKYGNQVSKDISMSLGVRYVCLCADEITIKHPVTGKKLDFSIQPEFLKFLS